jgi:hypothetical protein
MVRDGRCEFPSAAEASAHGKQPLSGLTTQPDPEDPVLTELWLGVTGGLALSDESPAFDDSPPVDDSAPVDDASLVEEAPV